jgi:hypothetical protein
MAGWTILGRPSSNDRGNPVKYLHTLHYVVGVCIVLPGPTWQRLPFVQVGCPLGRALSVLYQYRYRTHTGTLLKSLHVEVQPWLSNTVPLQRTVLHYGSTGTGSLPSTTVFCRSFIGGAMAVEGQWDEEDKRTHIATYN